jgi:very-short-patch-repair endonuclease
VEGASQEHGVRYNPKITNRARTLRKNMSDAEVLLWSRLRGRSSDRPTFRRQHPLGSVIVDFFCPSVGLAIEIDGSTHWDEERRERDEARDHWLARQGISVLRIPASAVYRDVGAVTDGILLRVDELKAAGPSARLAPSTMRSSAHGPPPAASRGR